MHIKNVRLNFPSYSSFSSFLNEQWSKHSNIFKKKTSNHQMKLKKPNGGDENKKVLQQLYLQSNYVCNTVRNVSSMELEKLLDKNCSVGNLNTKGSLDNVKDAGDYVQQQGNLPDAQTVNYSKIIISRCKNKGCLCKPVQYIPECVQKEKNIQICPLSEPICDKKICPVEKTTSLNTIEKQPPPTKCSVKCPIIKNAENQTSEHKSICVTKTKTLVHVENQTSNTSNVKSSPSPQKPYCPPSSSKQSPETQSCSQSCPLKSCPKPSPPKHSPPKQNQPKPCPVTLCPPKPCPAKPSPPKSCPPPKPCPPKRSGSSDSSSVVHCAHPSQLDPACKCKKMKKKKTKKYTKMCKKTSCKIDSSSSRCSSKCSSGCNNSPFCVPPNFEEILQNGDDSEIKFIHCRNKERCSCCKYNTKEGFKKGLNLPGDNICMQLSKADLKRKKSNGSVKSKKCCCCCNKKEDDASCSCFGKKKKKKKKPKCEKCMQTPKKSYSDKNCQCQKGQSKTNVCCSCDPEKKNKQEFMKSICQCSKCGKLFDKTYCTNTIVLPPKPMLPFSNDQDTLRTLIKMEAKHNYRQINNILQELNHQKSELKRLNQICHTISGNVLDDKTYKSKGVNGCGDCTCHEYEFDLLNKNTKLRDRTKVGQAQPESTDEQVLPNQETAARETEYNKDLLSGREKDNKVGWQPYEENNEHALAKEQNGFEETGQDNNSKVINGNSQVGQKTYQDNRYVSTSRNEFEEPGYKNLDARDGNNMVRQERDNQDNKYNYPAPENNKCEDGCDGNIRAMDRNIPVGQRTHQESNRYVLPKENSEFIEAGNDRNIRAMDRNIPVGQRTQQESNRYVLPKENSEFLEAGNDRNMKFRDSNNPVGQTSYQDHRYPSSTMNRNEIEEPGYNNPVGQKIYQDNNSTRYIPPKGNSDFVEPSIDRFDINTKSTNVVGQKPYQDHRYGQSTTGRNETEEPGYLNPVGLRIYRNSSRYSYMLPNENNGSIGHGNARNINMRDPYKPVDHNVPYQESKYIFSMERSGIDQPPHDNYITAMDRRYPIAQKPYQDSRYIMSDRNLSGEPGYNSSNSNTERNNLIRQKLYQDSRLSTTQTSEFEEPGFNRNIKMRDRLFQNDKRISSKESNKFREPGYDKNIASDRPVGPRQYQDINTISENEHNEFEEPGYDRNIRMREQSNTVRQGRVLPDNRYISTKENELRVLEYDRHSPVGPGQYQDVKAIPTYEKNKYFAEPGYDRNVNAIDSHSPVGPSQYQDSKSMHALANKEFEEPEYDRNMNVTESHRPVVPRQYEDPNVIPTYEKNKEIEGPRNIQLGDATHLERIQHEENTKYLPIIVQNESVEATYEKNDKSTNVRVRSSKAGRKQYDQNKENVSTEIGYNYGKDVKTHHEQNIENIAIPGQNRPAEAAHDKSTYVRERKKIDVPDEHKDAQPSPIKNPTIYDKSTYVRERKRVSNQHEEVQNYANNGETGYDRSTYVRERKPVPNQHDEVQNYAINGATGYDRNAKVGQKQLKETGEHIPMMQQNEEYNGILSDNTKMKDMLNVAVKQHNESRNSIPTNVQQESEEPGYYKQQKNIINQSKREPIKTEHEIISIYPSSDANKETTVIEVSSLYEESVSTIKETKSKEAIKGKKSIPALKEEDSKSNEEELTEVESSKADESKEEDDSLLRSWVKKSMVTLKENIKRCKQCQEKYKKKSKSTKGELTEAKNSKADETKEEDASLLKSCVRKSVVSLKENIQKCKRCQEKYKKKSKSSKGELTEVENSKANETKEEDESLLKSWVRKSVVSLKENIERCKQYQKKYRGKGKEKKNIFTCIVNIFKKKKKAGLSPEVPVSAKLPVQ